MRKHSLGSKLHRLLLRFFFILLFLRVFADGERSAGIEVEASASTIQPIPHHVKIVVDRIERELTFTEDDDLYGVAAAFVAQYGIGGDNTAGQCGGRQSAYPANESKNAKIAARNIHDAQKVIRKLDPKARFMYTKLPPPLVEEVDEQKKDEEISEKGIIDEKEVTA